MSFRCFKILQKEQNVNRIQFIKNISFSAIGIFILSKFGFAKTIHMRKSVIKVLNLLGFHGKHKTRSYSVLIIEMSTQKAMLIWE